MVIHLITCLFFIKSSLNLQVVSTFIKPRMSSNSKAKSDFSHQSYLPLNNKKKIPVELNSREGTVLIQSS